jgi:membrane protein
MARLGDVPTLLRSVGPLEFCKRVWHQISDDNLFTWAAALAYSWLFALFPFLLFLLALIPYLPTKLRNDAQIYVSDLLTRYLASEAAQTVKDNIEGNVKNLLHQPRGVVLYVGLLIALWAASGGMASTMSALDKCYDLDRGRPFYRQRPLAILMTIMVIFLLVLVGGLLPIGTFVRTWMVDQKYLGPRNPLLIVFDVARWMLSVLFLFTVLGMIYYKGPSIRHRFNLFTPGSVFCVVAWILLAFVLRTYMDRMGDGYNKTYGAVGGVAMLLLLFYVDALVLLIGAEINSEIDFEVLKIRRGSRDFLQAEGAKSPPPVPPQPSSSPSPAKPTLSPDPAPATPSTN